MSKARSQDNRETETEIDKEEYIKQKKISYFYEIR